MHNFIENDISKSLKKVVPKLEKLRGKTILITGGTGFVGSWTARALAWLNDEFDFKCQIILLARSPEKLEKLDAKLYKREDITFIRSDVRSIHNLPQNINYIIHSAATPDNRVHMSDPVSTMDVIAMGTKAVMEAATRLVDLEAIVHISSGQVYGTESFNEETLNKNMLGGFLKNDIRSIYPEAKRHSETICLAYRSQYKLPIIIVRAFSFIGPYQDLNKPWAINNFMQEALNSQPMRIVGNGMPQRSYLYASDMATWLLAILASGTRGTTYNLGSSKGISLVEVTDEINSILFKEVDVMIQNLDDDSSKFIPSIEHIKKELDVEEVFSFKEALEHTIKWNIDNLEK